MVYSAANPTHPTSPSRGGAHRANALPPGHLLDEYRIESILGAGGFGVTYKALDTHLESWVAIKEYFPIEWSYRDADGVTVYPNTQGQESGVEGQPADYIWGLERFLDEARVLARIQHPFVVRVKRYFRAHGTAYIVMDYEEGEPLNVVLRDGEVLSEEEIRGLLEDVLPALQAVHEQGYLHRDIKPANLYRRTCDHRIMLIDFGAARAALSRHSKSVTSLVTPGYSPPEQYTTRNDRYGTWTDIYALGAVLYRCITGRIPAEAAERLLDDTLEPAVQAGAGRYSTNLLKVIDRALAMRPEHRFSNVVEMQAALAGPSSEESDETVVMAPLLKPGHESGSAHAAAHAKVSHEHQAKESDRERTTARPTLSALETLAKPAEPVEQHRPAVRRSVITPPPLTPPTATPRRRLLAIAAGVVAVAALAGTGFWWWPSPPKETPPFPHSLAQKPQPGSPPVVEQPVPASATPAAAPAPPAAAPSGIETGVTAASGVPSPSMTAQSPDTPSSVVSSAPPPAVEQVSPVLEPLSPASTPSAEVSPPSAVPPGTSGAEVSSPTTAQPISPPASGAIDEAQTTTAPLPAPPAPAEPAVLPEDKPPVATGTPPVLPAPARSGVSLQAAPSKPAVTDIAPARSSSKPMESRGTASQHSAAVTRMRSARNRMERRRAPLRSSAALPSSAPAQRTYVVPAQKSSNPWDPPASTGFNQK